MASSIFIFLFLISLFFLLDDSMLWCYNLKRLNNYSTVCRFALIYAPISTEQAVWYHKMQCEHVCKIRCILTRDTTQL